MRHVVNEVRENPYLAALAAVGAAKGLYEVYVAPTRPSTKMWLAIGAVVVAYEVLCPAGETLSEACDRAIEKHPFITKATVGLLAAHLINIIPPDYDPIHQSFLKLNEVSHKGLKEAL